MKFGLTGCFAVAVLKLLGVRCCVRDLLLFLEGGDCLLVTPDSLSVHSNVYLRNGQFNSCDVSVRQGEKEWYVWCGQGGRNSLEGTDVYL